MRQVYINQYEKAGTSDINNLQLAMHKSFFDDTLYNFFGKPSGGVLGTSFLCSYVSALAASLAVGSGFYYDNTQTGFNPLFRMMQASAAIPVVFTAANASNPRIDLVCLAPNYVVTSTASRYVKTGGVGPITLQTVNKTYQDTYTLQVVAGTPGVSPTAPALPTGYIPIAQAYIHAVSGMASGADITDLRTQLVQSSNTGILSVIANFTASAPNSIYLCDPTSGGFTATLPTSILNPALPITIKNVQMSTGNNITVARSGSDLIEGATSLTVGPGEIVRLAPDGVSNWWLV